VGPVAQTDGHDPPGLVLEFSPSVAAMVDDGFGTFEHAVGEPVVAHKLPDVFLRVELGAFRRQGHDGDVFGDGEPGGEMPAGLVEQQCCVAPGSDVGRDRREVQVHRRGVAFGQDEPDRLARPGTDGTEDIGRSGTLVARRRRPATAQGPAPGDLVLLADPGLVAEPDLYVAGIAPARARDRRQYRGPVFLKSSIAPAAWA